MHFPLLFGISTLWVTREPFLLMPAPIADACITRFARRRRTSGKFIFVSVCTHPQVHTHSKLFTSAAGWTRRTHVPGAPTCVPSSHVTVASSTSSWSRGVRDRPWTAFMPGNWAAPQVAISAATELIEWGASWKLPYLWLWYHPPVAPVKSPTNFEMWTEDFSTTRAVRSCSYQPTNPPDDKVPCQYVKRIKKKSQIPIESTFLGSWRSPDSRTRWFPSSSGGSPPPPPLKKSRGAFLVETSGEINLF